MADNTPKRTGSTTPCMACVDNTNAEAAFESVIDDTVKWFARESHFSMRVTRCACGRHFAVVFTEIVDWSSGEDDMTWLVVPLQEDEAESLLVAAETQIYGQISRLGSGRRFISRTFPTGGTLKAEWCDSGFMIGHHD